MRRALQFGFLLCGFATGCGSTASTAPDASANQEDAAVLNRITKVSTQNVIAISGANNRLYAVTPGGGIAELSPSGELLRWFVPDGATPNCAGAVIAANQAWLAVATTTLDAKQLTIIKLEDGTHETFPATSETRSFLGMAWKGDDLYYSNFTQLYRARRDASGNWRSYSFSASPQMVRYWIWSPQVVGDNIVYAESARLLTVPAAASSQEGSVLATLPGTGRLVESAPGTTNAAFERFELASSGITAFTNVNLETGQVGMDFPLPADALSDTFADTQYLWYASNNGVTRFARQNGVAQMVSAIPSWAITGTSNQIYFANADGIWRVD